MWNVEFARVSEPKPKLIFEKQVDTFLNTKEECSNMNDHKDYKLASQRSSLCVHKVYVYCLFFLNDKSIFKSYSYVSIYT